MPKPEQAPRRHDPVALPTPRSVLGWIKRFVIGRPLASEAELAHRLPIYLALPLFASDALSSIAYASQEILHVLQETWVVRGQSTAAPYLIPLSIGIVVLMVIVAYSYRRAIFLYPTGGGSYAVARKNLGALSGLITGTSLIVDYNLTVAVSASSAMAFLTSVPQLQHLLPYKAYMAMGLVALMLIVNLRGIRESGAIFMLPAIAFVTMIGALIASSLFHYFTGTVAPVVPLAEITDPVRDFSIFALILAFASGCSALTGVEAVSNGVSTFAPPEDRNAAKTLVILICTLIVLFLGVGFAAHVYGTVPSHGETLIAQLARANFGADSLPYYLVIGAVIGILMVASNTAFAGMPQLLANMARDGYVPRVLLSLGDRLVYTRSIVGLGIISILLIWLFNANVSSLIPLYAVGVFLCFTMSMAGMFKRAITARDPGWQVSALINGLGVALTGSVMLLLAVSRFTQGAWVVVILIPALVAAGYAVKRHYLWFEERMALRLGDYNPLSGPVDHLTVVILLSSDIHRGTLEGLEAARAIVEGRKSSQLRALHIEIDPEKTKRLLGRWEKLIVPYIGRIAQLDIVPSPYRQLIPPVQDYLDRLDAERKNDRIVIMIPEFETGTWWSHLLHNQTAPRLRKALYNRPNVTVITNRFFMLDEGDRAAAPKPKARKAKKA